MTTCPRDGTDLMSTVASPTSRPAQPPEGEAPMTLDPQTRAAILDRGRHLHDMAVANGMDRGRYALRPVDGEMRIFPGPNFTALEPEDWVERTIDEHLVSGESA